MKTKQTSNYISNHVFVIQGWSSLDQAWQDSIYGGSTKEAAEKQLEELRPTIAMPKTQLRVVPALTPKSIEVE